jgi:hypothetical protein
MKRLITLCCIAIALVVSSVSVNAQPERQQAIPPPASASLPGIDRIPIPERPQPFTANSNISREPKVVRKGILAPDASDVAQQQFLLSQNKTGLMKLLPRESFDWEVYKVNKTVPVRGGGAYFSFHHRSHEYGYGSDISYERGLLRVGFAGANYGMITDLGDTPLELISDQDTRASFLLNYKPPRKEKDARAEAKRFEPIRTVQGMDGFRFEGVPYLRRVDAVVNHTYLLRSIDYRTSDLLVAFRIVRISDDGALTIAWKILKEFSPPELVLDKR